MMEFFLSKVWAFLVAFALLGVLLQGVQTTAHADRSEALRELAADLEELFADLAAAGPGLERTVHLEGMLPSTATLLVQKGYAVLCDEGMEMPFSAPFAQLLMETASGALEETGALTFGPSDSFLVINEDRGTTIVALSP